jgi:putative ATP-binding cassette transporter
MRLLELFTKESDAPKGRIVFMVAVSGLSNGLVLIAVNMAAQQLSSSAVEIHLFAFTVFTVLLSLYTQQYSFLELKKAIEGAICKVRLRIADKLRHSELRQIEEIGMASIQSPLTQDANLMSDTSSYMATIIQSFTMLFISAVYLAWLSVFSLIATVVTIAIVQFIYLAHHRVFSESMRATKQKEMLFLESLSHILGGFKEIKINTDKSNDAFANFTQIAHDIKDFKVNIERQLVADMTYITLCYNSLLIVLVFIIPTLTQEHSDTIFKITATILFILGFMRTLMISQFQVIKINAAVENLYELEKKLDNLAAKHPESLSITPIKTFETIQLSNMSFNYTDSRGRVTFGVGPMELTLVSGELLFIIGGNGSGKSTLLKLLTGLYYPLSGEILVDKIAVEESNYQDYRELFSVIFTDFHLFDRPYGLRHVDEERVKSLLKLMQLEKKTKYIDGKFTHLDLSTGQRKRLAFVLAVLEDKPVYVFDELAADQDPQFRKQFYEVILPDLKAQGKTIIAVSHDDHYFQFADRVLKVENGQVMPYVV